MIRNGFVQKLDGVVPIDNRPSTDKLHNKTKKNYMWYGTCDMWLTYWLTELMN